MFGLFQVFKCAKYILYGRNPTSKVMGLLEKRQWKMYKNLDMGMRPDVKISKSVVMYRTRAVFRFRTLVLKQLGLDWLVELWSDFCIGA